MDKYNMNVLDKNWLVELPHDTELKKYQLLSATQKLMSLFKEGNLHIAMVEVEHQLNNLYKLKNNKNQIDDNTKKIKGINVDTMSLDYEYAENYKDIEALYDLCDYAIDEFEAVFRLIRVKLRTFMKKIKLTEVPVRLPTKTKGIIFIKDSNDNIITYSYNKPATFIGDWQDMILLKLETKINNEKQMIKYIQSKRKEEDSNRFWRCDHTLSENVDGTIIPIVKFMIYQKLMLY